MLSGMKTTTLGERIKARRKSFGWTREDLADRFAVSPTTARLWEKNLSEPKPEKLAEIEAWLKRNGGK